MARPHPIVGNQSFGLCLKDALERRQKLIGQNRTQAFRAFSGIVDGVDGIFVDVYGESATLIVYEGRPPRWFDPTVEAATVLDALKPLGVKAVYVKPFAKDRSRLGGDLPDIATNPTPAAGETVPEAISIREANWQLEIRLYDGLSTGLFLDQRENRVWVADWCAKRKAAGKPTAVLNTFAYTCAFSVAAATGGAATTSVDVSGRYLDWGKRNFALNGFDIGSHRFAKMDTFEFFTYAGRKGLKYDLIVLDPPSFASGSKKKKIRPWSSVDDYARLVHTASHALNRGGVIFASTNTQALCRGVQLDREIQKGAGRPVRWIPLPPPPIDFDGEQDRFAARAFTT